jgi:hypothetical protein
MANERRLCLRSKVPSFPECAGASSRWVSKTLQPGDNVAITFERNGEQQTLIVEAVSR